MPVTRFAIGPALRAILLAVGVVIVLWCLLAAQPAQANVQCTPVPNPETLPFGSLRNASADLGYSCKNNDAASRTFFLCAGMGNPNPGTPAQPQMQNGTGGLLNYSVYRDAGMTDVWTTTKPIVKQVTIAAGQTLTGNFPYFARIATASPPTGSYTGFLFNTVLGIATSLSSTTCVLNLTTSFTFNSQDVTVNVTASVVPTCTLGTIGAIDFGTRSTIPANVDATGAVQFSCPSGLAWTLKIGGGQNAASGERRMRSGTNSYVQYRLYRETGRTTLLAIDGTFTGTGTGATQTTSIYGRLAPQSPPVVGTYQDFIVVTLSF
ncbi:MAG TPA: spore coat protein U domain-containing protein [Croceibacterium sp.]